MSVRDMAIGGAVKYKFAFSNQVGFAKKLTAMAPATIKVLAILRQTALPSKR